MFYVKILIVYYLTSVILIFTDGYSLKKNKFNPTLLISLDGFRSSRLEKFLKENPTSTLQKEFVENGVKADYMKPAFPSNTFPNHYSMITGR